MYPALVIRQALGSDADTVLWVGSQGGMEADLVRRAGIPYKENPAGQVAGMGLRTLPNMGKVVQGMLASRRILNDFKPDALLFTGGFVAVPMALAAAGFLGGQRAPSLVYVPDIEPGMALKLLAKYATVIALTTEESRAYFPADKQMVVTGYPTRPELSHWTRAKAQDYLGLDPDRFTLLVTGGSKGSRTINQPLMAILPQLLNEMQVIHITGQNDWPEIENYRAGTLMEIPADHARRYFPMPYLHEMGAALAAADLVISRAGASTLGEYPLFGLPAILVPYQYAWRYQKVNADYLVNHGAAVLLEHDRLSEELLPTVQNLSHDRAQLEKMRQAMNSLAQPEAAHTLAGLLKTVADPTARKQAGNTGNMER